MVIDADIIAHELVEYRQECLSNVINIFGRHMILDNGDLNRSQLRQLIFSNHKARQQLEKIIHPRISERLIKKSDMTPSYYCILCAPLLIEAGITMLADRILLIETNAKHQLKRVCQRDNISTFQAKAVIASQLSLIDRRGWADDIVNNNESPINLKNIVRRLHEQYISIAKAIS